MTKFKHEAALLKDLVDRTLAGKYLTHLQGRLLYLELNRHFQMNVKKLNPYYNGPMSLDEILPSYIKEAIMTR